MPSPSSIPDDVRAKVVALHKAGKGRNEIARTLGISAGSVTAIAKKAEIAFDRTDTAAAVEARRIDLAQMRADLEHDLLTDAQAIRRQLWTEHEYRQAVGGQEPRVMHWTMDEPTAMDKLKLMQAAGTAIDKSLRLAEANSETGITQAKSMLTDLFGALKDAWDKAPDA